MDPLWKVNPFTGNEWTPSHRTNNTQSVSMSWRHHDEKTCVLIGQTSEIASGQISDIGPGGYFISASRYTENNYGRFVTWTPYHDRCWASQIVPHQVRSVVEEMKSQHMTQYTPSNMHTVLLCFNSSPRPFPDKMAAISQTTFSIVFFARKTINFHLAFTEVCS